MTNVWTDDSAGGSTYNTLTGINVLTYLNPGTGTRHFVIRASTPTKSGTWDIFIEASAANDCHANVQLSS